jgi:hypothetical protein
VNSEKEVENIIMCGSLLYSNLLDCCLDA